METKAKCGLPATWCKNTELPGSLYCTRCHGLYNSPTMCDNNHTFCEGCMRPGRRCPHCNIIVALNAEKNIAMQAYIEQLDAICDCGFECSIAELREHMLVGCAAPSDRDTTSGFDTSSTRKNSGKFGGTSSRPTTSKSRTSVAYQQSIVAVGFWCFTSVALKWYANIFHQRPRPADADPKRPGMLTRAQSWVLIGWIHSTMPPMRSCSSNWCDIAQLVSQCCFNMMHV